MMPYSCCNPLKTGIDNLTIITVLVKAPRLSGFITTACLSIHEGKAAFHFHPGKVEIVVGVAIASLD